MRRFLALLALLIPTVPLSADPFEIVLWGSYRTGGALGVSIPNADANLDEEGAVGVSFGLWTRSDALAEIHYSVQATEADVEDVFGQVDSVDVDVEYLHIGGSYFFTRPGNPSRITGFVTGSVGGTRFKGEGGDSQTFFSGSLGGGANVSLSKRVDFRMDARFYTTLIGASGSISCTPGFCVTSVSGSYFTQFVASAGLALKF